jgi:putative ABC transport system permease protein
VGVAIAVSTVSAAQLNRRSIMKRAIASTLVLLGVFALGYRTARNTLRVHEENPGPGVGAEILIKYRGFGMLSAVLSIREMTQGLLAVPGVKAVAPIVTGVDSLSTVVYGIDPQSFNAVSGGLRIVQGRMFENPNEALIDEWQQSKMKVKVGDRVRFLKMDFTISGVVENGKGARIFIPLQTLQEKLKCEGLANLFFVKLDSGVTTKQTIDRIKLALADDTKEILDLNEIASLMSSN